MEMIKFIIVNKNHFFFCVFAERRPLKPQLPTPLFRSPSARLIQRDLFDDDRGSNGSNLCSLDGSSKDIHHYTFQPSKQIVSVWFLLLIFFLL